MKGGSDNYSQGDPIKIRIIQKIPKALVKVNKPKMAYSCDAFIETRERLTIRERQETDKRQT